MKTTVDIVAARELLLYAVGCAAVQDELDNVYRVLAKELLRGTYDSAKAPKAFEGLVKRAAIDYCKNFADPKVYYKTFNAATRRAVCREFADDVCGILRE